MEISRKWRFSCLLLGLLFLATTLQGVQGEAESEGPSESECRPYIEKALKELETAEPVDPGAPGNGGSKEDVPVIEATADDSEHDTSAGEDDTEKIEGAEALQEEQPPEESVEATEQADEPKEDEKSAEATPSEKQTEAEPSAEAAEEPQVESQEEAQAESQEAPAETASANEILETEATTESQEAQPESQEAQPESQEAPIESLEAQAEPQAESQEAPAESQEQADAPAETESQEAPVEEAAAESQEAPAESQEEVSPDAQEEAPTESTEAESPTESVEAPAEAAESTEATEADKAEGESAEAAAESTEAPAEEVAQSDEAAEAPAESVEAPAESAEVPAVSAEAPAESVEAPAGSAEKSVESAEVPAESAEAPAESAEAPAVSAEAPAESAEAPAESAEAPTETADAPVEGTAESAEATDAAVSAEATDAAAESAEAPEVTAESAEAIPETTTESVEAPAEEAASPETEPEKEEEAGIQKRSVEDVQVVESTEAAEESKEAVPEEDLIQEMDVPENLRERSHIDQLLKLDDSNLESEAVVNRLAEITLRDLKRLHENAIKPLETLYKYRDLSNRHFGDSEIFSKPLVLFMGPWSGGKSSIINYLLNNEYNATALRTGAEPSPAYFNLLMHGDEPEVLDGTQLAADFTFAGLQKFGQGLEERLRGLKLPSKLLEKINIVEIPGILEVRKQVSRMFPFNDACQWFIDRADIIFLVYDPSKLDVGPETEAILDQLKGREHQTRIILNKADQVKPEELMRVQGALIWNISPLMSSAQPPVMYTTSLWSRPYEAWAPVRLLQAQERAFLRDLRSAVDKRIENKISSARRFAVRVRNHAKMVDCYLTTYYNHKSVFGNRKQVSDQIIEHPQDYHIYEGLSTLTNISRYDLPDPDVYRDFFRLNPLYDFQQLSATCTYFRGCPINRLDVAIAYDLPEMVGKHKKLVESALAEIKTES